MHSHPLRPIRPHSFRQLRLSILGELMFMALASTVSLPAATAYVFSHLAGPLGGFGNADGVGPAARFNSPRGTTVDGAGNVYVADVNNFTIRKITPTGIVTTLAGTAGVYGSADGTGAAAQFYSLGGVAVDGAGNVYVADSGNYTVRKITPTGVVTTLAGTAGVYGSADGTGAAAQFYLLSGVAVDGAGNVYVADSRVIRKITAGGVVTTLAGTQGVVGSADGTGSAAQFYDPTGVAVDGAGYVYVADSGKIRKITPGGVVTTVVDMSAHFDGPYTSLAVDGAGNILAVDVTTIHKIAPGGMVTILAGMFGVTGSADGTGSAAQFNSIGGVAVDGAGNAYVADTDNDMIRKITPAGVVTTMAGMAGSNNFGSADGTGAAARFDSPQGVAVDGAGNVYVADTDNDTIRKITPDGAVTTFAGAPGAFGSKDGTGAAAQFDFPRAVAVDGAGNVYIADGGNRTIRKITPTGVVTTFAGTAGAFGSADGTGAAAQFMFPIDVAADGAGNVYVADSGNATIRKITPNGVVTTLAGTAGVRGSVDGTGAAALFNDPVGVGVDGTGNVYVADSDNDTIRKIAPGGVVTTLAGTAGVVGIADGTGAAAQFNLPGAVAVDGAGNVYVVDLGNNTIRKISPTGVVTTVAGTPHVRGSVDGIGPVAQFNGTYSVAVDSAGNLYVADIDNNAIRKGEPIGPPVITTQPQSQSVTAGSNVQFGVSVSIVDFAQGSSTIPAPTYQWYFNGNALSGATRGSLNLRAVTTANAGDYTVVVTDILGSVTSNKATLTVSSTPTTPSGGSSGGGSIGKLFVVVLLALGSARHWATRTARRV